MSSKIIIFFEYPDGTGFCEMYDRCGNVLSRCQDADSFYSMQQANGMTKNQVVMRGAIKGIDVYSMKHDTSKRISDIMVDVDDMLVKL